MRDRPDPGTASADGSTASGVSGQERPGKHIHAVDGQSIVLRPVKSAARQLVQLSLHYLVNQPSRICLADPDAPLPDAAAIGASPRMVAFVDVPPGARFPPQAAGLNDGRVATFFSPLIEKLKQDGGTQPGAYPRTSETQAGVQQRDAYWGWFAQHWNADEAVKVVEEGIGSGGRPRWIDYRLTCGAGQQLHLHSPRGRHAGGG